MSSVTAVHLDLGVDRLDVADGALAIARVDERNETGALGVALRDAIADHLRLTQGGELRAQRSLAAAPQRLAGLVAGRRRRAAAPPRAGRARRGSRRARAARAARRA